MRSVSIDERLSEVFRHWPTVKATLWEESPVRLRVVIQESRDQVTEALENSLPGGRRRELESALTFLDRLAEQLDDYIEPPEAREARLRQLGVSRLKHTAGRLPDETFDGI